MVSTSSLNWHFVPGEENLYYPEMPTRPVSSMLPVNSSLSRSVPGLPQASQPPPEPRQKQWGAGGWNMRWDWSHSVTMSGDAWTIIATIGNRGTRGLNILPRIYIIHPWYSSQCLSFCPVHTVTVYNSIIECRYIQKQGIYQLSCETELSFK